MEFSLPLVRFTRSLTLSTPQETTTNPRTFGIENSTSTRHPCQYSFLNSGFTGSTGYSRIPQGLLLRSLQQAVSKIRIDPSSLLPVRLKYHFAKRTANGHSFATLRSTRSCHPVIPSPSYSRKTARFMSCNPSPPSQGPGGQALQANAGIL